MVTNLGKFSKCFLKAVFTELTSKKPKKIHINKTAPITGALTSTRPWGSLFAAFMFILLLVIYPYLTTGQMAGGGRIHKNFGQAGEYVTYPEEEAGDQYWDCVNCGEFPRRTETIAFVAIIVGSLWAAIKSREFKLEFIPWCYRVMKPREHWIVSYFKFALGGWLIYIGATLVGGCTIGGMINHMIHLLPMGPIEMMTFWFGAWTVMLVFFRERSYI